jgi:hypothetical protein
VYTQEASRRTDVDWLDSDALFDVGHVGTVGDLVVQDLGLAEGVDKGGAPSARGTLTTVSMAFGGQEQRARGRGTMGNRTESSPTTMRLNWTPFLTLFPRRRIVFRRRTSWKRAKRSSKEQTCSCHTRRHSPNSLSSIPLYAPSPSLSRSLSSSLSRFLRRRSIPHPSSFPSPEIWRRPHNKTRQRSALSNPS